MVFKFQHTQMHRWSVTISSSDTKMPDWLVATSFKLAQINLASYNTVNQQAYQN